MRLTKKTLDLICKIEHIIGSNCYNPRSHDGYTGEDGCYFRYPVHYNDEKGEQKTSFTIPNLKKEDLESVLYKFGSNELLIGTSIFEVLEYLEKQFGLDFNELLKK